jgi:hypothetical protein
VYRAVSILIILFWLTMTGLLLRSELKPGDSALREVPPGHVVKLILHHRQKSELNIVSDKMRLGRLHIEPKMRKEDGMRVFTFTGYMLLLLPGGERQKVAWDGECEMDKELAVHRFRLGLTTHESEKLRSEVVVLQRENVARYTLSSPTGLLEKQSYSLDEKGAQDVMRQLGIDPSMLPMDPLAKTKPPEVKARQSSIEVQGEPMDTYAVSVEVNGQTLLECHVNQLGQIVKATTIFGYGLMIDDISP